MLKTASRLLVTALAGLGFAAFSATGHSAMAQPASPVAGPDATLMDEIVIGSRILADAGVLDGFGHVSARNPGNPGRFLMSRSLATALVTADDIMEFDLDGNAIDAKGRAVFLERFIHGEVYKARPDVQSVVHSHSPSVVPFSLVPNQMRAMYHNAAFIAEGVPVFDIAEKFGATDMLVGNGEKGRELARVLGAKPVCLMRAHGSVATGPSLKHAVFRAVYTEVNAKLQIQATIISNGGNIAALSEDEGRIADTVNVANVSRPWDMWKRRIAN